MDRRLRELALIAFAGALLTFETVALMGALPVLRRTLHRVDRPRVRVISLTRDLHPAGGKTTCTSLQLVREVQDRVAARLVEVML